jgi:hypothetical protein
LSAGAPLWRCPACGQRFVSRNLPHSCEVVALDACFEGRPPHVRELFDAWLAAAEACGPVIVNTTRSRITFQVRMRFGGADRPRGDKLVARLVLTRPVRHRLGTRVDYIAPYYYDHRFTVREASNIDDDLRAIVRESYGVGEQRHVSEPDWPRVREPPAWVHVPGIRQVVADSPG